MLSIRRATEADRFQVFKLSVLMHRETDFKNFDFDPEAAFSGIGAWLGLDPNHTMFVAQSGDEIVGMLAASIKGTWFGRDKFVTEELFYVAPASRGSRAGFLLMRSLVNWWLESGVPHIRAGVATGMGAAAERLYQHFGMRHVGGNYFRHSN